MADFNGTSGNDTYTGGADADIINGQAGDDTLNGGEGADTIDGGAGLDKLYGDGGDDLLRVANATVAGEVYDGGTGFDTLEVLLSAGGAPAQTGGGYVASGVNLRNVSLTAIESLKFGSSVTTGLAININYSQLGSLQRLEGGAGYDQLTINVTGSGTFTAPTLTKVNWEGSSDVFATGDIVRLFAGGATGSVTLNASTGHRGVEFLLGGNGDDTLNGSDGAEILNGQGGANILNAGGGNDLLHSVNMSPTIYETGIGSVFDGGAGFDYLAFTNSQAFQGTIANIEGFLLAPSPNVPAPQVEISSNVLLGTAAALHLRGSGTLEVHLEDGHNFDGSAWVHEAGSSVGVQVFGGASNTWYIGTGGNDRFSGGFGSATMTGGLGADQFEAGAGQHVVTDFEIGVDKVDVRDLNIVSFAQLQPFLSQVGSDVVLSRTYNGVMQTMTLKNVSLANLDASSFVFQTSHSGDTLTGTESADHLLGAFGNDTLLGLGDDDVLYASKGDDSLDGGAGNDVLTGGEGNDSIVGGAGIDTASFAEAAGPVTVDLAAGTASGADGSDTLSGIENLSGSAFDDYLKGDAGANFIDGGAGNDTMIGGLGDDVYVQNPGDTVIEEANGGIDELLVQENFFLAPNTEKLTALGNGNLFLGGNELDNVLTGNSGDNYLRGNGGNDQLIGGAGRDSGEFALPGSTPGTLRVVEGTGGKLFVQLVQVNGSAENVFEITLLGSGSATVTGLNSMSQLGTDAALEVESLYFFIDVYPQPHAPGQTVFVNTAIDAQTVQNNFAHVNGSPGSDTIDLPQLYPGAGSDVTFNVYAGSGNDTIIGSSGRNYIDGEAGSDTIDGGAGNDTAAFRLPADTVGSLQQIDHGDGTFSIRLVQADGSFENIFLVTLGAAGSATVQALGSMAHYGTDTVSNVEDLYFVVDTWPTPPTQSVSLPLASIQYGNFVSGSVGNDTINLAEFTGVNSVDGGAGNDIVTGTGADDYLVGAGGNDTLNGAGGRDIAGFRLPPGTTGTLRVIEGAAGRATIELVQADGSAEIVFEITSTGAGAATIAGVGRMAYLGTDTVSGIEEVHIYVDSWPSPTPPGQFVNILLSAVQFGGPSSQVMGSITSDTIDLANFGSATGARGGNGDDVIIGTSGANTIAGDRGNDTIAGNGGNDHVQYFLPADFVGKPTLVKNADGTFAVWRVVNGTQLEQIFHISQANGTITVTGMNGAAYLGTDTLTGVESLGIYPEGPHDPARALHINVAPSQNGTNDTGGIFGDLVDFGGRATGVNFFGDFGDDFVIGSDFNDTLNGGQDNDTLSGAGGADSLFAGPGNDVLYGGAGNDQLVGAQGADTLDGGDGDDTLIGGTSTNAFAQPGDGADVLRGGAGTDVLRGADGDDRLEGGTGDDNLRGDAGNDYLDGGDGVDFVSYIFSAAQAGKTVDFRQVDIANGTFTDALAGTDTLLNLERLGITGSEYDDVIYGTGFATGGSPGFANQLYGAGGNDQIHGAGGRDYLRGEAGNDVLYGGQGSDVFGGTLAQWNGDMIADLEYDEEIGIDGVALASSQVQLALAPDGSRELRIDGNNDGTFETVIKIPDLPGQLNIVSGGTTPQDSYTSIRITPVAVEAPAILTAPALIASDVLTVAGTADAGLGVSLYNGTTIVGQTVADADGAWSILIDGLEEGINTLTAIATDANGQSSAPSTPVAITVDTIAPPAPEVEQPTAPSNDSTPEFSGTAEAGSTVRVTDGGTVLGEAIADANGDWTVVLTDALADGSYALSVIAIDAAGNASAPSPLALIIDTAAPIAPTIGDLPLLTNLDSLSVAGTATPMSEVSLYDGAVLVAQFTAQADGSWSITLDELVEGTHAFVARANDDAGNSASSTPREVVVDLTAPDSPIVESEPDTTDATPQISGVAEIGSAITIESGGTVLGAGVTGNDGTWSITLDDALADGPHELLVVATDAAGNRSAAEVFNLTVSGTAPPAPVINTPETSSGSAALVLTGLAAAGSTVEILRAGIVVATTTADAAGAWTANVEGLEGANSFTAVAIDPEGDRSPASAAVSISVDTIAPGVPEVESGELFATALVPITGKAEAGSIVTIAKGNVVLGAAIADATGHWTYIATAGQLAEGGNMLTATARDAVGNESEAAQFNVTVDTTAPSAPVIDQPGNNGYVDPAEMTLVGSAEPGAAIAIYDGGILVGETFAEADGIWSVILSQVDEGEHTFTARATDEAGNASLVSAPQTIFADASPPTVTLVSAELRSDTGVSATDNVSNTGGITLTGTAEPGSVLTFSGGPDGATPLAGSLVVGPSGSWSFVTTLPEGTHKVVVTATDAAGNAASTLLPTQTFVIDKSAPVFTMTASLVRDTGTAGDNNSSDGRIAIAGTGEPGRTVSVFDTANGGSVLIGTATVAADGSWSLAQTTLPQGSHQLVARSTDIAGNTGSSAPSPVIVVDAVTQITMTQLLASDTGASNSDGVTRNGSVTLSGTGEAGASVVVRDGNTVLSTQTVGADGTWSYTTSLADGSHQLTATATDRAGNTASATGTTFVVDRAGPAAPTLTVGTDTPIVGGATRDTTINLSGSAEANARASIYDGAVLLGVAVAGNNGQWSFTTQPLADGQHSFTARAEDLAGNVSPSTAPSLLTVDTVPPPMPVIAAISTDTGQNATDRVTSDTTLAVQGTGEAGSTINIYEGTQLLGTTTVAANGTWTANLSRQLSDGVHGLIATASDRVGNVSPATAAFLVTIDSTAPSGTAITSILTDGGANPSVANGGVTRDTTLRLTGSAEALAIVQLFAGTTLLGEVRADATGSWTFDYAATADGQVNFTARAVDLAGNTHTSRAYAVTVDSSAPIPVITGAVSSKSSTSISGTADAGTVVQVFEGDVLLGTATASKSGTWKITSPLLSDANAHLLRAVGTDAAGNVGQSAGVTVMGTSRADTLASGAGDDVLLGYGGNDRIDGGLGGNDRISGGAGNDIFVFQQSFGNDTVTDYQDGLDKIDLDAGLTFNQLIITTLDADGDGAADDVSITVGNSTIFLLNANPANITADDFLF